MARSMGDFYLKQRDDLPAERQIVTADPDILGKDMRVYIYACVCIYMCV